MASRPDTSPVPSVITAPLAKPDGHRQRKAKRVARGIHLHIKYPSRGYPRYWREVPKHLKKYVGRTAITVSLGSYDPAEIMRQHGAIHAAVERQLAEAQAMYERGIDAPDAKREPKASVQVIAPLMDRWRAAEEREYTAALAEAQASGDEYWLANLRHDMRRKIEMLTAPDVFRAAYREDELLEPPNADGSRTLKDFRHLVELQTGKTPLEREIEDTIGISREHPAYEQVARLIAAEYVERMTKRLSGSPRPVPVAEVARATSPSDLPYVSFESVVEAWALRAQPSAKSKYQYGAHMKRLATHLGHDDASRVTEADIDGVDGWIDALTKSGESQANIQVRVNCIKTLFKAAHKRKLIPSNPAADVEFKAKRDPKKRKIGYNDEQAKTILVAAREQDDPVRRWAVWLCAFTGARLGEVCGAMATDIVKVDGVDCLRIDPMNRDDGETVKNAESIRHVPLHPALVKEGFVKYVATLKGGDALFPDLPPDRYGKRAGTGSKRIGRWVRGDLGITSRNIQPSHAWRHRFTNECINVGMPREHRYALEGHSDGTVSEKHYQEPIPVRLLHKSICLLKDPTK